MKVPATGEGYLAANTPSMIGMTIHPLKENKRPIGFAPWPDDTQQDRPWIPKKPRWKP